MSPGFGIVASSKQVAAGGPTVSVIESVARPFTSSGSDTVSITTTLLTTDRVVIIVQKGTLTGTPSASGLGGTWNTDLFSTAAVDYYIFSTSGVTGTGTVTVSGLSTAPAAVTGLVLRASNGAAVVFLNGNMNSGAVAAAGTLATSSASNTAGALLIGSCRSDSGTLTFPDASSTPNSGFTTVRNTFDATSSDTKIVITQTLASTTTVQLAGSPSAVTSLVVVRAAYYV